VAWLWNEEPYFLPFDDYISTHHEAGFMHKLVWFDAGNMVRGRYNIGSAISNSDNGCPGTGCTATSIFLPSMAGWSAGIVWMQ
jgi:hypothetical protein